MNAVRNENVAGFGGVAASALKVMATTPNPTESD